MAGLTKEERAWIASFRRLAKKCPPTLALWADPSGGTSMSIVPLNENGGTAHSGYVSYDDEAVCAADCVPIRCLSGDPTTFDFDDLDRPWVPDTTTEGR